MPLNGRIIVEDSEYWYFDNQSLALDLRILWLTIRKVLKRDGISATGEATMPRFTGESK